MFGDLQKLLEYCEDEKEHWEMTGKSTEHIYCSIQRLQEWLEHPKCHVLVQVWRGLLDEEPRVFFDIGLAAKACADADATLGIVRDEDGHYEHHENICNLYELEIK
jgi:hypothetical protein